MKIPKNNIGVSYSLYADMAGLSEVAEVEQLIEDNVIDRYCDRRSKYIVASEIDVKNYIRGIEVLSFQKYMTKFNIARKTTFLHINSKKLRTFYDGTEIFIITDKRYYKRNVADSIVKKPVEVKTINPAKQMISEELKMHSASGKNMKLYTAFMQEIQRRPKLRRMEGQITLSQFIQLSTEFSVTTKRPDAKLIEILDFVSAAPKMNRIYDSINFHLKHIKRSFNHERD